VAVHFVHARNKRAPRPVDHGFAFGRETAQVLDTGNALAVYDDIPGFRKGKRFRIENAHIANANRAIEVAGGLCLYFDKALRRVTFGFGAKRLVSRFIAFPNDRETRVRDRE
jgi:hypothetical protein